VAYATAIDIYALPQVAHVGAEAMRFVLPDGATVINPDAIAILRNPPHPELAARFLEWALSRAGQSLWMLPRGAPGGATRFDINRMCVMPALYEELQHTTPVRINPFAQRFDFEYDGQLGTARRGILAALLGAVFIDIHKDVTAAWSAIQESSQREALVHEFVRAPLTEGALLQLAGTDWKDAQRRNQLINHWQNSEAQRLRELRRRARATSTR
jgi:ABC-type glycerol-3-phosphate transport system substrate-binding protein